MSTPISNATEELQQSMKAWQPQNVADYRSLFRDLPDLIETIKDGFSGIEGTLSDGTPIAQPVVEHIAEMIPVLSGLQEHAEELGKMFEALHAKELERIDNPRAGEEHFDVTQQD